MATVADQIEETRRHLYGMHRAEYTTLGDDIDDSVTTVPVDDNLSQVSNSSIIAVDDELIYVFTASNGTLTVSRGFLGSTAAEHDNGALVEVNPRWPRFAIKQALQQEMRSWAPELFQVVIDDTLTCTSGRNDVDISSFADDWLEILRLTRSARSSSYVEFRVGYRAERALDKLFLDCFVEDDIELTAAIAVPIARSSSFADADDLVDDLGQTASMSDIAPLGAAWRLVAGREVRRNVTDAQGEPRDAQEVPPGSITATARALKALRDERIRDEAKALRHRWPFRRA